MRSLFGLRLWLLVGSIVLLGGSTIIGLSVAWERIEGLETNLDRTHLESFRLADEVQHGLLNLNNSMLHYVATREPQLWRDFERASAELDHWIDAHAPAINKNSVLTTTSERDLFQELNKAYDDYRDAAAQVHTNHQPALVSREEFAQLGGFDAQAQRLLLLGNRLAEAHRD